MDRRILIPVFEGPFSSATMTDLKASLGSLTCPADENCHLHIEESPRGQVMVFLERQKSVVADSCWLVDHDPKNKDWPYIYAALFDDATSANEIIKAIRKILEMPEL